MSVSLEDLSDLKLCSKCINNNQQLSTLMITFVILYHLFLAFQMLEICKHSFLTKAHSYDAINVKKSKTSPTWTGERHINGSR